MFGPTSPWMNGDIPKTRASHRSWKTGSSASRSTGPKCSLRPPMSLSADMRSKIPRPDRVRLAIDGGHYAHAGVDDRTALRDLDRTVHDGDGAHRLRDQPRLRRGRRRHGRELH